MSSDVLKIENRNEFFTRTESESGTYVKSYVEHIYSVFYR